MTATALHPVFSTSFGVEDPGRPQRLAVPLMRPSMRSRPRALEVPGPGRCNLDPPGLGCHLERVTGQYFVDCTPRRPSDRSYDAPAAAQLCQVSADLVRALVQARPASCTQIATWTRLTNCIFTKMC
ncbi:MAG TPA: hypothetical protein VHH34_23905, partial [Pseudonocardiaceae bacterium]|nr:hypothetical protein [Pseudonocardiaceae bacterium]